MDGRTDSNATEEGQFHVPGQPGYPAMSAPLSMAAVVGAPRPKRRWVVWTILVVVILGLGGGGYFAYSRGYISIPFLSPKSDELFSRLVESLSKIDNAQYKLQGTLKAEARQAGVKSIFPSSTEKKSASRDDQRKSDLAQIRTALLLYYDDHSQSTFPSSLDSALTPSYISALPTDPKDKSAYPYATCDGDKHYILYSGLETGGYYYLTDLGQASTSTDKPVCGQGTNTNQQSFLQHLIPAAHAQATTFSIESIDVGLGEAPTSNLPLVPALSIFGLGDLQSIIDIFPTDIDTTAGFTFYTEADKKLKDADGLLQIAATYHGGDLTAEFDVEGRKIGSTVYGIVRKFPGIPYVSQYVTPIKDKWVKISPDDGNSILTEDTWGDTSIKDAVEKTKQSLKLVLEGQVFTVDKKLGTDNIAGVQSAHYRVAIHPDKFKGVFEKIIAERKTKKQDTKDLEAIVAQLNQPNVQASLQRFADSSTVDIWIDKAQGLLRQISWDIILVPPEDSTKLKDKQFHLGLMLTLDKVNQKVSVSKPGGTIDYNEAERLVTGISVDEQKFNKQRSRVTEIRSTLSTIKTLSGAYPDSIDDLAGKMKEAKKVCETKENNKNSNGSVSYTCLSYLPDQKLIPITDIYTQKPFEYKKDGEGYRLTYQMKLDFESADSAFSYGSYYKDDYVEGTNTASEIDVSREKHITTPIKTNVNTNTALTDPEISAVTASDYVRGEPSAKYTLIEYGDFESSYSKQFHETMKEIFEGSQNRVQWVFRHKPMTFHPQDQKMAEVALCAGKLKGEAAYWIFVDEFMAQPALGNTPFTLDLVQPLFATTGVDQTTLQTCLDSSEMAARITQESSESSVTGVPTTFLLTTGGRTVLERFEGATMFAVMKSRLRPYLTIQEPSTIDEDSDGLSNANERVKYKTNPYNRDTDNDSYSDGDEIKNGYNPKGSGKLVSP